MYQQGHSFINNALDVSFKESLNLEGYYDSFESAKQLKLLDISAGQPGPCIKFYHLVKLLCEEGTISPNGKIIETPLKIKLPLKIHQKRTLYEMKSRENSCFRHSETHNVNLLCDNVGSGKSLCVLSLIADSPMTTFKTDMYYSSMPPRSNEGISRRNPNSIRHLYGNKYNINSSLGINENSIELKTNLIIIPHNVFNQWKKYINEYTSLSAVFIGGKKDYTELCTTKEHILKKCDENDIILVKSTMYKKLIENLNIKLGWTELEKEFNENNITNTDINLRQEVLRLNKLTRTNFNEFLGLTDTCSHGEDKIQEVHKKFEDMTKQFNLFINNDNWKNIIDNRCKRMTSYKSIINGYYFQRVIVDEVDSIKVSAFPYSFAKQTWFITSSINNLLWPNGYNPWNSQTRKCELISSGISGTGFLKEILVNMFSSSSSFRSKLECYRGLYSVVRNNNKFVEYSINIPPPNIHYLECYTPPHLSAIKNAISKEALKAFNAGDSDKAIEILGCSGSSEENIVSDLTKKFHKEIKDLENKLKDKKDSVKKYKVEYDNVVELINASGLSATENSVQLDVIIMSTLETKKDDIKRQIGNMRSNIRLTKTKISNLKGKIEGISSRIKNTESKQCPICYCDFSNPCITPCCNNVFCIECITMALASSAKKECPLCRKTINIKDMSLIINSDAVEEKQERLKTKLEYLLEIIKSKPDKRFMVFSEFNSTLSNITTEFLANDIRYSSIKGHSTTISRTLTDFKDKKFNVLLLNAVHFGAGLNLQFTDEIIIWHRMSSDLECQVIGRAQRLGRKLPLDITYLCYDNEYSK